MENNVFEFKYDVFISHSSQDKDAARELARRLRFDGFQVWFDEQRIAPGESIPERIEDGLQHSRTLLLLMSQHAFDSDWVSLERQASLFRCVSSENRRFIPVRLDDTPVRVMLAHLKYIDYSGQSLSQYDEIKQACMSARYLPGSLPEEVAAAREGETWKSSGLRQMIVDRIGDQYDVDFAPISNGRNKVVFRARDRALKRYVALIVPQLPISSASQVAASFCEQMRVVSELKHRNVISVYGGLILDRFPILICEYVNGVTLRELVEKLGPQPLRRILCVLSNLAKALKYAHDRRCIHHKLRPENVLMDATGEAVITPLRILGEGYEKFSDTEEGIDEVLYLSPERYLAETTSSDKSAQYVLGLIGYEMLSGRPFVEEKEDETKLEAKKRFFDKQEKPKDIPYGSKEIDEVYEDLWSLLSKMLRTKPGKRPSTLSKLITKLEALRTRWRRELNSKKNRNHATAIESYKRCRVVAGFFKQFYDELFKQCPEVRRIFKKENLLDCMEKQYWVLREAIELLLDYQLDPRCCQPALQRVADRHNKEFGVTAAMYESFVKVLLTVVGNNDPKCCSLAADVAQGEPQKIKDAWEKAIEPAMLFLRENAPAAGSTGTTAANAAEPPDTSVTPVSGTDNA